MDRLLARLERTILGRIAIEKLTTFIVGGMAIAFMLCQVREGFREQLVLVPWRVTSEPWRLVSFLFVPPERSNLIWVALSLYFTWLIGTNLEQAWGALKFNAFYFVGALCTLAAGLVTGESLTNVYLNISLFVAFATIFPDYEIRIFFILPMKVKWVGMLVVAFAVLRLATGENYQRVGIAAVTANYLLFFGGHLLALARGRRMLVQQAARRAEQRPQAAERAEDARVCAICGAKQKDGADIRVCSCDKCGGVPRQLCLEHARSH